MASNDSLYNQHMADGKWPSDTCEKCLKKYYACKQCGRCIYAKRDDMTCECGRGTYEYKEQRYCCVSWGHHLYAACEHCGNDERNIRRMKFRGK
jgi:hypothetical protein